MEEFVDTSDVLATTLNQAVLTQQAKLYQSEELGTGELGYKKKICSLLTELAKQEGQAATLAVELQHAKAEADTLVDQLAGMLSTNWHDIRFSERSAVCKRPLHRPSECVQDCMRQLQQRKSVAMTWRGNQPCRLRQRRAKQGC